MHFHLPPTFVTLLLPIQYFHLILTITTCQHNYTYHILFSYLSLLPQPFGFSILFRRATWLSPLFLFISSRNYCHFCRNWSLYWTLNRDSLLFRWKTLPDMFSMDTRSFAISMSAIFQPALLGRSAPMDWWALFAWFWCAWWPCFACADCL